MNYSVELISDPFGGSPVNSDHHFSVDCSSAHRGLFAGIMVIVLTIISLIMFFVLAEEHEEDDDTTTDKNVAEFEVNIVELLLYILTTVIVLIAMWKLRDLKYDRKVKGQKTVSFYPIRCSVLQKSELHS